MISIAKNKVVDAGKMQKSNKKFIKLYLALASIP